MGPFRTRKFGFDVSRFLTAQLVCLRITQPLCSFVASFLMLGYILSSLQLPIVEDTTSLVGLFVWKKKKKISRDHFVFNVREIKK